MKCPLFGGRLYKGNRGGLPMKLYGPSALERAMKIQEVILRAMSGQLKWTQAADILAISPRSLRRWRGRYELYGYDGLLDRRTGKPSPRRAPVAEVEKVLRLYRERYQGFNVRHFHGIARREHEISLSYSFVKKLQEAGLVKKRRKRGRHRKRRERRALFGEMLHLDGSRHRWLARNAEQYQTMITVVDDATNGLLYAQLWKKESTWAVMTALGEVIETYGIPMALYTDRASWAFHTPKAGGRVDKENLTQVGRCLARLGVEHIPSYSPQARGRSERINRTLQDRLVNELRIARISTIKGANRYLRQRFLPQYNQEFKRKPALPQSAFVPAGNANLNQILCLEEGRTVAKDNTVVMNKVRLQIDKQPGRASCAGLRVIVRKHLDNTHTVWWGTRLLGRYNAKGKPVPKQLTHSTELQASNRIPVAKASSC